MERLLQGGTEERSRLRVEINGSVRMRAQNRSRRHGADRALHASLDGLGLARSGHDRQYLVGFKNLACRHGDGALRHLGNVGEPRLAYLLLTAGFIEVHDEVRDLGLEVSGWIVECDVRVLDNSE